MTERMPALRWLIALLRHDLGVEAGVFDERIAPEDVVALAEAHRVTVLAERSWQALAAGGRAPPPPATLSIAAARAQRRSLLAAAHLARLAPELERRDVPWIALKGPALSMQLHGDPSVRVARDLDVIVPAGRLDDAVAAAARAGWTTHARWRALLRVTARYDMEMRPTLRGQPLLELHAGLAPRFVRFAFDPFAPGAGGPVSIGGCAVPTLVGPALATYVAWHGGRGFWYRLSWLLDLARLLPRDGREAARVLDTARRAGAEVPIRAGAAFAQSLFGIAPPPWPEAAPAVARKAETVLRWAVERLDLGVDAPSVWCRPGAYRWLWREVAQQDDPWRSAIGVLGHIGRPTEEDAERLGLDRPLALHRLARPYFVAGRLMKDLARRAT